MSQEREVVDLVAALRASVEAAKRRREAHVREQANKLRSDRSPG